MAQKITKTITTGYIYDVFKKKGDNLTKVATLTSSEQFRSAKGIKEFLKANEQDENATVILVGTIDKKYEISEEDFIKYATEIKKAESETAQA